MPGGDDVILLDALLTIFTWIGLGVGALLAGVALILYAIDGTWVPVRAVVERTDRGLVARWFGQEGVGHAPLSEHDHLALGGGDEIDAYIRVDSTDRLRRTRRSPLVRAVLGFAVGFLALGALAFAASWIILLAGG
ncbi:MAG: hypothetical protein J0I44_00460 [Microbacterium sp.]|nr:hypothetical protein [Microbacterium sp.]